MDISAVGGKLGELVLYTILPFGIVLGIMIFVHELGHFLAARAVGVRVLIFKLGFGKFIWSVKRGHTEYGVAIFPIGGYVALFGDPTEDTPEGEPPLELDQIPEEDRREALISKTTPQKFLVFFAGSAMNVLLAFVLAPLIYMMGVQVMPPVVGLVEADSPAAMAGIQPNDRIVSIDGKAMHSYRDVAMEEAINPNQTLTYLVERDGKTVSLQVTTREAKPEPIGESGITPPIFAAISDVVPGSPAETAGLKPGDTVTQINEKAITHWSELQTAVNASEGKELTLTVTRNGEQKTILATPNFDQGQKRWLLGVAPIENRQLVRYSFGASLVEGARLCFDSVVQTYVVLWKLLSFQLSPKVMSGPLGIGAITSAAAHVGFAALLSLTVLIGVNLGVLNLLPIPPLDGGHILFIAIERVIRREIKVKYKEAVFKAGMMIFLTLMVLVTVQDFFRYKTKMGDFFLELLKGLGLR